MTKSCLIQVIKNLSSSIIRVFAIFLLTVGLMGVVELALLDHSAQIETQTVVGTSSQCH